MISSESFSFIQKVDLYLVLRILCPCGSSRARQKCTRGELVADSEAELLLGHLFPLICSFCSSCAWASGLQIQT